MDAKRARHTSAEERQAAELASNHNTHALRQDGERENELGWYSSKPIDKLHGCCGKCGSAARVAGRRAGRWDGGRAGRGGRQAGGRVRRRAAQLKKTHKRAFGDLRIDLGDGSRGVE